MAIAPPEPGKENPPAQPPANPPPAAPPANPPPAAPPANPPAETADQKAARLEQELKDAQAKNTDLSTTIATIEERERDLRARAAGGPKEDEIAKELEEIENLRLTDPQAASKRNADLLRKISDSAATRAQVTITQQATIDKLRAGVRSSNPDFDDEVIDYVMERADRLATTGKFKTADEAVTAAVTLVKSKFDGYALKKNAAPPLPPGARAEGGGNPPPAADPKPEALPTPAEELGQRREAMQKKII